MSAKVHTSAADVEIAPAKMSSPPEPKPAAVGSQAEAEFVKCDCCGLTEECTPTYIARIRGRHAGRWICGLCAEAVKDEIARSGRPITTEEALDRHMSFSKSFRSSSKPPPNPKEHLISAMRQLLRRSLSRPRATRSTPPSPRKGTRDEDDDDEKDDGGTRGGLARTGSCFSTIGG